MFSREISNSKSWSVRPFEDIKKKMLLICLDERVKHIICIQIYKFRYEAAIEVHYMYSIKIQDMLPYKF